MGMMRPGVPSSTSTLPHPAPLHLAEFVAGGLVSGVGDGMAHYVHCPRPWSIVGEASGRPITADPLVRLGFRSMEFCAESFRPTVVASFSRHKAARSARLAP